MTRLCVLGPSGRMGRMVLDVAAATDAVSVTGALDHAEADVIGAEVAPGVTATADPAVAFADADAYIDFTVPSATAAAARAALDLASGGRAIAAVIGTTGLDGAAEAAIDALAARAPVVVAPNFSLGVNVLLGLAEKAARALPDFDVEVVELHHRHKRDAPSGTALALGRALAAGRGADLDEVGRYAREGDVGPRTDAEIGVVAVRGGGVIGEHTAYLFGPDERIEISHRAADRSIFAAGAIRAARWAADRPPGRYGMTDVLGL